MLSVDMPPICVLQGQYHRKAFHPHLIECRSSVEKCMSVFLTDAYREREATKKGTRQKSADTRLVGGDVMWFCSAYMCGCCVLVFVCMFVRVFGHLYVCVGVCVYQVFVVLICEIFWQYLDELIDGKNIFKRLHSFVLVIVLMSNNESKTLIQGIF